MSYLWTIFVVRVNKKLDKDATSLGDIYQSLKQNVQWQIFPFTWETLPFVSTYVSHVENEIFLFFS